MRQVEHLSLLSKHAIVLNQCYSGCKRQEDITDEDSSSRRAQLSKDSTHFVEYLAWYGTR